MDERIIKIVEISGSGQVANSYGYPRKAMRVVRCLPDQRGHKTEKNVEDIYESTHYAAFSRGPKSNYMKTLRYCEKLAARVRYADEVGLVWDTPLGIINDKRLELGLPPFQE